MSQGQPRRMSEAEGEKARQPPQDRPVKYGDVFDVSGSLAAQPVAPRDAALMQSAEDSVLGLGQTQKGGPAAAMQSAATVNARAGHVGRGQLSGLAADEGVAVTETQLPGRRVVTESVAGQTVGQFVAPEPVAATAPGGALGKDAVTIGRALEAAAASAAGGKPVDQSDAAAIMAAETRATGSDETVPGGVAATAQSAADMNDRTMCDANKVKLRDVLSDARSKLPADKGATREDAERVVSAEIRNKPNMSTTPGGVADAVTTAARLNQERA
ncbi:late embryogenesis abundant protein D-34-like [Brachypodium distachyon]|uniref:SMP domain-containing protein n=1 Tax=Brachypodium distachyon TaxID=15368 RepID=I1GNC1_BRADI|nr:late embryogenesis abundant protein D-34-like [Brachypodium distachyon]KQK13231.1 hypothetical protein BRADI_1g08750v3 [Brachypodium distachyon]|eukprot:XP_024313366.1 late embryogenesis abundant protein D-34-like [Brachypodium distachyon]